MVVFTSRKWEVHGIHQDRVNAALVLVQCDRTLLYSLCCCTCCREERRCWWDEAGRQDVALKTTHIPPSYIPLASTCSVRNDSFTACLSHVTGSKISRFVITLSLIIKYISFAI